LEDPFTYLLGLERFGIKFGLENIAVILDALDHPERAFLSVHVGGTNGKGSVTALIETALRAAGHRSARYTSPHLLTLNERFVIDGRPVSTDALAAAISSVREIVERLRAAEELAVSPTFFEVTTAVAFELFRRAGIRIAVLEVGLGGRLDATNVVRPLACAITSIALDHEQYLGGTLEQVAAEKAGIIKPGVPVVVGDIAAGPMGAIARIARERGAPLVYAAREVSAASVPSRPGYVRLRTGARDYGEVAFALRGSHQLANAAVAVRLLELLGAGGLAVPPAAIVSGLATVSWPGRLDVRRLPDGRQAILDAAHNPAGAVALSAYLDEQGEAGLPLVFSAMRDKDIDGMLRALLPAVGLLVATRASNPRAADPAWIAEAARRVSTDTPVIVEPVPRDALATAWRASPRIVIAGSIFLLADVLLEFETS
jgi:dihydrofolate synthase / folylpolyglutamate synthase